ncbi:MAG: peptide-methionine (S)-S-oxide reductase MsrA [Candidatus Thorarchaeota archaeon]|jgi:peptide-methionine (S)-S-oxide reductase
MELATFGGGCFWCVEAVFQQLKGVTALVSGYAGGKVENPTYEQVSTGTTGHAEVCQISFSPEQISYEDLLEVFFETHDPTTLNRQGNDVGTQYRSVILFHNEEQRKAAEEAKAKVDKSGSLSTPVVTEIVAYTKFYRAEDYHQDYFKRNRDKAYCKYVIRPKLDKFEKVFKLKLGKK